MNKRLVTAVAVGVVATAMAGGAITYIVDPDSRVAVKTTIDCRRDSEIGCGSAVTYGPRRGWSQVITLAGVAGALACLIAYRLQRPKPVPEARTIA